MEPADLAATVSPATSLRVTRVGAFDSRHRSKLKPFLVVTDAAALSDIRDALAINPASFAEQIALLTPGILSLHFLRGHQLLASVDCVSRSIVRWSGWPFDALLIEPPRLARWLAERGVKIPELA